MAMAIGGLSSLTTYSSEDDEEADDTKGLSRAPSTAITQQSIQGGLRSTSVLQIWLDQHRIQVSTDVEIIDTEDAGWTLRALRDLPEHHILCKIPKTAILSLRTTSLVLPTSTPGYEPRSTHSVWFLALALLHEMRLGTRSRFYGYIQSLPRETIRLPMLWGVYELCGEDGQVALRTIRGTDAARDLEKQKAEGKSVDDLECFYNLYSNLLPPTALYPRPGSFLDYLYAYSLVSTRAFVIDVYHTLALCPFADILNHAHPAHTSLSSDDFVCHICGSLRVCQHDRLTTTGIPQRLDELSVEAIHRLEKEEDTVDLTVEVEEIRAGHEIYNSYGADLSSSQLLREWGYFDRGSRGYIMFDLDELGGGESVHQVGAGDLLSLVVQSALPHTRLIAPVSSDNASLLGIHRATGTITLGMWCQVYLSIVLADADFPHLPHLIQAIQGSIGLLQLWEQEGGNKRKQADASLGVAVRSAAQRIVSVLGDRVKGITSIESPIGPLSQMAHEYAEFEQDELHRVVEQWKLLAQM